ncbi:hypothetical protein HAX54_037058 [Datura stramonium]|uniref:Peptidase S9 prolyl oligopeptidase catalytic domain-containing protein n=1 Tax=Datura stramonium TaxID=4076 RepID=A0ABS8VKK4_DATST|nr:hypothetical protein [Datura stramonium]
MGGQTSAELSRACWHWSSASRGGVGLVATPRKTKNLVGQPEKIIDVPELILRINHVSVLYIEQLVASAEAAVEEVIRRGVADPNKIAVGGHSYGAFMTANLLAHAPHLFCCGIARSGAYNRTLTPFGFQNEERTLWEATNTYVEMSPFMSANKIKKPILLIHGEEDNNSGTLTMQSDRFFNALKGHGALCRLVILPYESHGYGARESIMHVLWETDRWLQKHCVYSSDVKADVSACKDNAEGTVDSQSKAVGAAGGVQERVNLDDDKFYSVRRSLLW